MNQFFKSGALIMAIASVIFACNGDNTPDFELGRYEYAGLDNKTFRFFRVENGGVFREVNAKRTGIGVVQSTPFCDEDFLGKTFYDCGFFPNLTKPFFEFRENEVEMALFYAPDEDLLQQTIPYVVEGDSLVLGVLPDVLKLPRPTGNKNREILWPWRIYQTTRFGIASVELVLEPLTEKEHLQAIQEAEQLSIGDTIAICLLKEKFVKK